MTGEDVHAFRLPKIYYTRPIAGDGVQHLMAWRRSLRRLRLERLSFFSLYHGAIPFLAMRLRCAATKADDCAAVRDAATISWWCSHRSKAIVVALLNFTCPSRGSLLGSLAQGSQSDEISIDRGTSPVRSHTVIVERLTRPVAFQSRYKLRL